ncbi:hypothetical protein [Streptomyces sp. 8N616]|uniref:hypothetical protein n=1 Tax=Streptomyces sp. 8N616 TaxID=3457414 RepID=UPI003FD25279
MHDAHAAVETADVWWLWAGMPSRAEGGIWGTSLADPVLVCVHTGAAIAALRSAPASASASAPGSAAGSVSAAGALGSAAVVTIALRIPSLWTLQSGWMRVVDEDLRSRATLTAGTGVLTGVALLVAVAAGRRRMDGGEGRGVGGEGRGVGGVVRPGRAASVIAFLFLGVAAGAVAAWQIHWAREWGWRTYGKLLVGDGPQNVYALLQPPFGWLAWTVVLVSLAAAVAALARTAFSRPLGMTAATMLLARGLTGVSAQRRTGLLAHVWDLPVRDQLSVATAVFELLAGVVVLAALGRRGRRPEAEPYGGERYGSEPYGSEPHGGGQYGSAHGYAGGSRGGEYRPPPPPPGR